MHGGSRSVDTEYIKNENGIRKRESGEMQLSTELHQQSRCRLAFNKLYVDLVDTTAETCVFGHGHAENTPPRYPSLCEHRRLDRA